MWRVALYLVAGMAAGIVVATWLGGGDAGIDRQAGDDPAAARRVAALEHELAGEAARREDLEQRLAALERTVETLRGDVAAAGASEDDAGPGPTAPSRRRAGLDETGGDGAGPVPPRPPFGRGGFADQEGRRISRLVDAGFSEERAQWIEQRTSELRMQALQTQYDAARSGGDVAPGRVINADQTLRDEIGDSEYERYLEALNRPTRIGVRDVLASSPAEQAGLQAGDEIVSYGGRRVFGMSELNALTLEGQPGETVAVDVVRDGQQIQLYVPRGPIGITGGGAFMRRP